jgi:hypothetical protein
VGKYSLAEAYSNSHQEKLGAFPFGGINPGALAATRQLPPETRIWSTNTSSYWRNLSAITTMRTLSRKRLFPKDHAEAIS